MFMRTVGALFGLVGPARDVQPGPPWVQLCAGKAMFYIYHASSPIHVGPQRRRCHPAAELRDRNIWVTMQ